MPSPTTYPEVIDGLVAAISTVPGLLVLAAEPDEVTRDWLAYLFLDSFERGQAGQVTTMTYTVTCRLVVQWANNHTAEAQLAALINPVCAAIDADATLGSRVTSGLAKVARGEAGFIAIGQKTCRYCDIAITVLTKGAYKSGI